jgi:hypothetical protein
MFTIDSENNIVAHAALPAGADQSQSFSSAKELAKLTAEWPASRLVDTWNSFAGVAPFDGLKSVKKFTNRKLAVVRIWTAVARLSARTVRNQRTTCRPPTGRRRSPRPVPLFDTHMVHLAPDVIFEYDVRADGRRFLINTIAGSGGGPGGASAPPLTVVTNWAAGLKK